MPKTKKEPTAYWNPRTGTIHKHGWEHATLCGRSTHTMLPVTYRDAVDVAYVFTKDDVERSGIACKLCGW